MEDERKCDGMEDNRNYQSEEVEDENLMDDVIVNPADDSVKENGKPRKKQESEPINVKKEIFSWIRIICCGSGYCLCYKQFYYYECQCSYRFYDEYNNERGPHDWT